MKIILALLLLLAPSSCIAQRVFPQSLKYYELHRTPVDSGVQRIYQSYWRQMEKCSGLRGNFKAAHFYEYNTTEESITVVDLLDIPIQVVAWWEADDNSITILRSHLDNDLVIKHEMLHALIGVPGHPKLIYTMRCRIPITYH